MNRLRLLALIAALALVAALLLAIPAAADQPPKAGPALVPASQVDPAAAPQAVAWYDGMIKYSQITNCFSIIQGSPYIENGAAAYVGFAADPDNALPGPNQAYYIHVVVGGLGNSCSGQRAYIDIQLPTGTSPAIDAAPVQCFYDGVPLPGSECPQTLPTSSWNIGAYAILSVDTAHAQTWPIPQGRILEIRVPVRSVTTLTNATLQANVWMLDGNSSPWLRPQQGVYVFSNTPSVLYPSPSTITVTATTARSLAYLYTFGTGGTGYFDLGYSAGSYTLEHEAIAIPAGGNAFLAWDDWTPASLGGTLQPDTLYHWRFTFTPSAGSPVVGPDQSFRTLPDGQVTVGNGQAGTCTTAALDTALATAKTIRFDCGLSFVTIPVSAEKVVATGLSIDGGGLVTLDGGNARRLFSVSAGGQLTLTNVTLSRGRASSGCGGAVSVASGGKLTARSASFISNGSNSQGGAICVNGGGFADIQGSVFMTNTAGTHGGAIGNYGVTLAGNSRFTGNSAPVNGGGIDSTGSLTVTNSTFSGNSAGFRGGGVYNYLGTLYMGGASVSGNLAGAYGGGVSTDAGVTTVETSTISLNNSPHGGGLQSSGTLVVRNSTVSGNQATAGTGGGVAWDGGTINLMNDTIANNTASTTGGNIHASAPYDLITPWNTIVADGSPNNCDGAVWSRGYNLESANTCGFTSTGDRVNTAARLGALENNGGPTLTRALMMGSAAINAANNAVCPAKDQRGVSRPQMTNCDIGAYEYRPVVYLPLTIRP